MEAMPLTRSFVTKLKLMVPCIISVKEIHKVNMLSCVPVFYIIHSFGAPKY